MAKITIRVWILIICLALALLAISPSFSDKVIIKSIENNSTAYQQGLRAGEVITEINSMSIKTKEDYTKALSETFSSGQETRVAIKTEATEYIFLATNLSEITIGESPSTKIKTGLDLSGGTRAVIRPANATINADELNDLVAITNERLNAFGLSDVTVRPARDLEGNNFMVVEIAGASPSDIKELLGQQGKFEAKIANQTVFEGGNKDVSDVCRNDANCAGITGCSLVSGGQYACSFHFAVYLNEEAARKHANITANIPLDSTGQYLTEKIYLYVDNKEVDSLNIGSSLRGQVTTQISIQGSGTGPTQDEALKNAQQSMKRLQTILLTGSLPYTLEIVKLDTISPALGGEFTRSLLWLALVVFVIVSITVFVKYRKIKITFAVILTMVSEALLTLGIAALIRWNLDAPAIAGIIAGIGTGLNDQIVIIDETFSGASEREGVKERVKRALFIILGAFLTIIAAMIPLFWAGAGMLRGFALTTIIGVSVGILITRPAFADIIKKIAGQ